jgi:hypothetical protein
MQTNFSVRNCRICHLKASDHLGLLMVLLPATVSVAANNTQEIGMNNRVLSCLIAGALSTALALASPALARGGGGHGGGGGGGHGGGMGGGMHGGGMHGGGWGGGGAHFSGMRGGAHFSGSHFAGRHFAHAGFSRSRFAFRDHDGFHHRFFHHRFNRFAFVGAYGYDSCWRREWTPYGQRWVDACSDYGYY